ncbi:MAG TPA: hypothetical protein VK942_01825 [Actinomycetes bacterium]|nr:hypothetical protein [Actinomycetes bacterium]
MTQPDPQAPPQVPPQPLPTRVDVDFVRVAGPGMAPATQLLWQWQTPAGVASFFTDRGFAQQIAQILMGHLSNWPAELIVPQLDIGAVERELHRGNGKQ